MSEFLTYRLPDSFIEDYKHRSVNWGYAIGAGNSGSEINFIDKYSARKEDGSKERWYEVVRRCVEGSFSIHVDHCAKQGISVDWDWVQDRAIDMYERMFEMKWMPPGRGLQFMGTHLVNGLGLSDALYNCSFVSTKDVGKTMTYDKPFTQIMIELFMGIGTGFDTDGAGKIPVLGSDASSSYIVPDTREGWVESVRRLLVCFFYGEPEPEFDYTQIRPKGALISTFGGVCPGYKPLERIHQELTEILNGYVGGYLDSRGIVDVVNIIGRGVVSGGQRRSAQIALGDYEDEDFVTLKDWNLPENEKRMGPNGWGNLSNNSTRAVADGHYPTIVESIIVNGEPGMVYPELAQNYGRIIDGPQQIKDSAIGPNPCGEIFLESFEKCNLADVYPGNHTSVDDYVKSCEAALLYTKSVTLLATSWDDVNEIIEKNRRIGISNNGVTEFMETSMYGGDLETWVDKGYRTIKAFDHELSSRLNVSKSVRLTAEKPNGNTSVVAGVTPGVHWPVASGFFVRRMQYSVNNPLVPQLEAAGYPVEPYGMDPDNTVVISFPMEGAVMRSEREVSLREKAELAATMQRVWADNMVSCTLSFLPEEAEQVSEIIRDFGGKTMKSMAFYPMMDEVTYAQQPYEKVTRETWEAMREAIKPIDLEAVYAKGDQFSPESYCANDSCVL